MPIQGIATLWPTAENYQRFKEVCSDEIHDTAEAYHASAGRKLDQLAAQGIVIERVPFDPDELAAWAAAQHQKINSQTRAAYAGFLLAERDRSKRRD